jgi:ATP-dependent DNA helicase RecQ
MTRRSPEGDPIDRAARSLGYDQLRPGQREGIEAVVAGRDTVAILRTGSGKSAIYQVAGLLRDGPTIVVSPLVALQLDQAESLTELGLHAATLNSAMSRTARQDAFAALAERSLDVLLLAPEQLTDEHVLQEIAAARPGLFCVDEAHCISAWGHDFRPDYLLLGGVVDLLGHPPVLALTATASPLVREDVIARLGLQDPVLVLGTVDRPEIEIAVERHHDEDTRDEALVARVAGAEGEGIVYAATRKSTEALAAALREAGVAAAAYHAGMRKRDRVAAQEAFMEGELRVMVATTAFGMGVDKEDVRFVFHAHIPDSLDSYWQEVGRAGRDGEDAQAILFYRPEDVGMRRFFASGGVRVEELEAVAGALAAGATAGDPRALAKAAGIAPRRATVALQRIAEAGGLGRGGMDGVVARALEAEERRKQLEASRVDMMVEFCELDTCRRAFLLGYFGDRLDRPRCGRCDVCHRDDLESAGSADARGAASSGFVAGERVRHKRWGDGTVQHDDGARLVVAFDAVGYKTLAVDIVRQSDVLEAA